MIMKYAGVAAVLFAITLGSAHADDLTIGYLAATTGPFSALAKRNAIAIEIAVEEINAKGGVNGKKLKVESFDTGGKPDLATAGVTHFAEDTGALAIVGPFSTSEC